jgi:hypothetical protein
MYLKKRALAAALAFLVHILDVERELARIATMENTKTKEAKADAKSAKPASMHQMTVEATENALLVLLDFFNLQKDRITVTPNVLLERSREQVPLHARIATTANTRTKQQRANAKRVGRESSQPT